MLIQPSRRVQSMGAYAFAEVDLLVQDLKSKGIQPIDFGVGDPTTPTPELVRRACCEGADKHKSSGYPSYQGSIEFRRAAADWLKRRFGVDLNPETEISSTIGSKEAVFNFAEGFVDPGDCVIVPTPGYPPYSRGALFAEGESYFVPLLQENSFLPDLDSIPAQVREKAKIMWLNYPNSPTGVAAPLSFLEKAVDFGRENGIIIASDEAYSELYFTEEPPHSSLEVSNEGVVAFFSLSKRSAMTGYRVGWVAGDSRIIEVFRKVKTNIDSGTPSFVQEAAIAALADEKHVKEMRADYRRKRDILVSALVSAGLEDCTPETTIYLWQKCPQAYSSLDFAKLLLQPENAIVTTPGAWISDVTEGGMNPGEGYVRFALVPSIGETEKAAERIRKLSF